MDFGSGLSHAYIIAGPGGAAGDEAVRLSAAMLCASPGKKPCGACRHCEKVFKGVHPDVIFIDRPLDDKGNKKREIYVDQIRAAVSEANILPNEAEKKVYVVRDADTMNTGAQNAFLKLLEEPPRFTAFILVAQNTAALLDTVKSRCVIRSVRGGDTAPDDRVMELADKYLDAAASGDRVAVLRFCRSLEGETGAFLTELFALVKLRLADILCGRAPERGLKRSDLLRLVELMDKMAKYLRFNVGVKHVLGIIATQTIDLK